MNILTPGPTFLFSKTHTLRQSKKIPPVFYVLSTDLKELDSDELKISEGQGHLSNFKLREGSTLTEEQVFKELSFLAKYKGMFSKNKKIDFVFEDPFERRQWLQKYRAHYFQTQDITKRLYKNICTSSFFLCCRDNFFMFTRKEGTLEVSKCSVRDYAFKITKKYLCLSG